MALAPQISEVLELLASGEGLRFARMSGSGATCFGVYASAEASAMAARALASARPRWWVRQTVLR